MGRGPRSRGQGLVEFALVLPVLVLLLFGVMEFGRFLDAWLVVTNAVREGARVAAERADATTARARACAYLDEGFGSRKNVDVFYTCASDIAVSGVGSPPGSPVTVTATVRLLVVAPVIAELFPSNPFPIQREATMPLL